MEDFENTYFTQTMDWLNNERNKAIKTAFKEWPDDYKFIADASYWFTKITESVISNPPIDNVRSLIVIENIL